MFSEDFSWLFGHSLLVSTATEFDLVFRGCEDGGCVLLVSTATGIRLYI